MSRRLVSLFTGIGGIDLGFERAGFTVVAQVEKDMNCRNLLKAKWPDAVILDDVCTAGAHNLPSCGVITFGFPCQDLSVAGKRAGLAGGRSGLFYEATRIIHELNPAYCLLENVPGLLTSDGGKDFERVLREMDRIGYSGAWRVLDAQWLGVAQRRRRVFGLFSRLDSGAGRCAEILSLPESLRGHPPPGREAEETPPPPFACGPGADRKHAHRPDGGSGAETQAVGYTQSSFGGYREGCGTLRASGGSENLIVSGVAPRNVVPAASVARPRRGSAEQPPAFPHTVNTLTCRMQGSSGWAPYNETEHLIPVQADAGMAVRRLTPTECERLQGFPDGWTEGFGDTVRYRMLGNAVCVNVAEWIARRLASAIGRTGRKGGTT